MAENVGISYLKLKVVCQLETHLNLIIQVEMDTLSKRDIMSIVHEDSSTSKMVYSQCTTVFRGMINIFQDLLYKN